MLPGPSENLAFAGAQVPTGDRRVDSFDGLDVWAAGAIELILQRIGPRAGTNFVRDSGWNDEVGGEVLYQIKAADLGQED